MFSPAELARFQMDGFVVVRDLAPRELRERLLALAKDELARRAEPVEYEADLHYPGAPASRTVMGGETIRRLLQAYARHEAFRAWATHPLIAARLKQLLGPRVVMPQAHHNCIMTKQPRFSSETGWHQDIRYWAFSRPELVSVWLALGREGPENGCLMLIPGTHRMEIAPARFDERLFLRADLPENQGLIARRVLAPLGPGDVLFFHARTFHAAGRNATDETKFSLVFTYRPEDNPPLAGTRSAGSPDIPVP